MLNRIVSACLIACVGLTGCSTQLSPSQRYGAAAVAYSATLNTVVANQAHLSDSDLEVVADFANPGKAYLDRVFVLLTDGDPTNDSNADALLWTLENEILPRLAEVTNE